MAENAPVMNHRWLPLVSVTVLAIVALAYAQFLRSENGRLREANAKLDEFCLKTRLGVQEDRKDFESGDPRRQAAALDRFYAGRTIHHDPSSLLMCLENIPPYSAECFLGEDWTCRVSLALEIELALHSRYSQR